MTIRTIRRIEMVLMCLLVHGVGCAEPPADDDTVGDDDATGDDDTISDDDSGDDDTAMPDDDSGDDDVTSDVRVPAEWEPHGATWLQWPNQWEATMRPAFADIVGVIQDYESVHLITGSQPEKTEAEQFLASQGVPDTNLSWHVFPMDNAWMRDNGPVYVTDGSQTWIEDFRFDAWGGNFGGHIPYQNDDAIPGLVADYLGIPRNDHPDYVLERGNLEFNGAGALVLNWDCQNDRNPGMTEAEHEAILAAAYGHDPSDGTTGHIDGYARFVDVDTIAIGESSWGSETEEPLAAACEAAGLEVVRIPCPASTDYMNWLVGDGFVAAMTFGIPDADAAAQAQLQTLFPGRNVHMIDASTLWNAGGGVHCVTNDQPMLH